MEERSVTISLEEYTTLLELNYKRHYNESFVSRIYNLLEDYGKTSVEYWKPFVKGVGINETDLFIKELLELMYYHDTYRYQDVCRELEHRQVLKQTTLKNEEKGE